MEKLKLSEPVKSYIINWLNGFMINNCKNQKSDLLRVKKIVYDALSSYDEESKKEVLKIAKENIKKSYE